MKKNLSEMTIEELWELFPIFLTEYNPCWENWYEEEQSILQKILPMDQITRISHVGSTSVKIIWAKPIIDILVETVENCDWNVITNSLVSERYICMCEESNRISFNKGYTKHGFAEKVYHLHLRRSGDNDELYFRDYINKHPQAAKEYENLKLGLWKKYEHNRDAYTQSKTDFIKELTQKAKEMYGKIY